MSSQVPTTNDVMISDIAFESNYPYSLHPTATNSSINVGDNYFYQSGVRHVGAGGGHNNGANDAGPLVFSGYFALSGTDAYISSSRALETWVICIIDIKVELDSCVLVVLIIYQLVLVDL